jgi:trimeric autotransporter adhesin
VTFTNETDSGWQQQGLPAPLSISANTPYIISVNTAAGFYVASVGGLSSPVLNQDLRSIVGSNGLFGSPGTFPTGTFSGTNYFRDVFFTPSSGLISVSLNPATVMGGSASTGTVLLSGPAPTGGATVSLSGDTGLVTMPATVTVPTGALGATFTVTTQPVASLSTAAVTATYDVTRNTTLTITNAPSVSSVALDSPTVTGGSGTSGTVTLDGPAVLGGMTVILSSNNSSATVPPSVTVAAGATTATFPVNTTAVGSTTTAAIRATLGVTQAASLTINPPAVSSLNLNPSTVTGGLGSIGTVTLNDPAPAGGAIVALLSDNATATVPASVTVTAGATAATFSISTLPVPAPVNANISATYGSTTAAVLTVTTPFVTNLSFNATHVVAGTASSGSVTISGPAPAGGSVVALTSDLPTASEIEGVYSPADLPQGGSVDWASFGPEYTTIRSGTVIPVTGIPGLNMTLSNAGAGDMESLSNCDFGGNCAWYGNFASGTRVLWVNGTYYSDTGWWAGNGPLTLQFASPQRGVGFQAMGDETGPFTATVCAYNSSNNLLGCVPFTGNGTGVADGSAAFMGVYDDAQEISKVVIDAGGTLYPHDFGISQLFVTGARRTFIPSTVIVSAGTTTASFPINATTVATPTTVNITASLSGTRVSSLTLDPAALASIIPAPSTVLGGVPLTATVTLTGKAPAGGAVVTLSADNPVSTGVQFVNSATQIPHDNTVTWTDIGPSFTSVASNTAVPIPGAANSTVTVSNSVDDLLYILTNCPAVANCGFSGNFVPAAPLLWVDGSYDETGTVWTGDGPLTMRFSNPQRGVGFNIMADEAGPFSGTVCAYDSSDTLLGCKTYNGNGAPLAGGTNGLAIFTGIYDDKLEISKVTIDGAGALYPHDFAIGPLSLATNRRMVPQTVTVQAGASTATFPVNTDTVDQVTTVSITGNYQGTQTAAITVNPASVSSISLNPSTVTGGSPSTGTVTLNVPAPANGSVVTLSSDSGTAITPASVTVLAGATTATFTINTAAVSDITTATIKATYNGVQTAGLTVKPPPLIDPLLTPAIVIGGNPSTGSVTIGGPAPAGGATVRLSSDNPAAIVPPTVTVPAGAITATFIVNTIPVNSVTMAGITGSYNGVDTGILIINPPSVLSVSLTPTTVIGATSSTGTVTLDGAAPQGGAVVQLSSDSSSATVPATVMVPAGSTTATFKVGTTAVALAMIANIRGNYNGSQSAPLTTNAPSATSVTLNPATVIGGGTSTGNVTLNGPAPTGGAIVTLSSSAGVATVPASVTIAAGATAVTFKISTTTVSSVTTVTIGGAFNGTQTASLAINPSALQSLSFNPATVTGSSASTGTVKLSAPAPAGGLVVTLTDDSASSTTPVSVKVPAGATSATFTEATVSVGDTTNVTITASVNGSSKSATLTLNPPKMASIKLNPASLKGGSANSTVTIALNAPAAGTSAQRTVTLSSSNPTDAALPPTVTVASGATTATFTVTSHVVKTRQTSTISATMNGVTQTAILTITP